MINPDLLNGTPTAPGATEFDEWLRGKNDQAAKRAALVVGAAKLTTTPTEAARRKAVAELSGSVLGTPLSTKLLTEPNVLSMVEGKVESTRALDTLSANPKLASWIADQDNAAIASDRIGELGLLSEIFNGVARGGDKLYEDLLGSGANFRSAAELLGRARDSQRTFDEIMTDQKKSQSVGAMDETKRDALVRLQRDMGPGYTGAVPYDPASGEAASISTNVASVKRWLESRIYSVTAFGQGEDAGVGKLEGLAADAAADVQRQDTERQEQFPTGRSAADISRQFSEMPEDASFLESTTAMFSIVRDNPSGFVEYLAGTAAESGVALIASTAVTAATRSPTLGRAALFGTAVPVARASNTLEVASSMGYDLSKPEDARRLVADQSSLDKVIASAGTYATVVSLVDAATAGLGSQLIKNPVGSFIMEAVTQAVAGGGGEAFARLVSGQKWSWTDVILEGLAEMVTAPLEAGGLASETTFRKYKSAQKASDRRSFFQALSKGSAESELRKRSPEAYKSAVTALTKDGPVENVYIDAARMEQLFQDAPEQLTALFDRVPDLDYRAFKRAAETGGTFAIPTAVYAADVAGTDIDARLTDNLRLRADQLSYAEAQEAMAETETQMKDLEKRLEELKGTAELDPVVQHEYESLVTQLVVAGRAPGVARAEAQLLASTVQTMAQRQGMTSAEFVRRNLTPVIRREGAGAVTQSRVMRMNDLAEGLRDPIKSGLPEFEAISAELVERGVSPETATEDDLRLAAIAVADKGGLVSNLDEEFLLTPSGIYRATPGETMMQTVRLRSGEEDLSAWGHTPGQAISTRELALVMQARQRATYGKISRTDFSAKTVQKMASWMTDEIEFELQTPGATAEGWYTTKFQRALDVTGARFPEFDTEQDFVPSNLPGLKKVNSAREARQLMTMIVAVTSNGSKVVDNYRMAVDAYRQFRETGRFLKVKNAGERASSITSHLNRVAQLVSEFDSVAEVNEFLTEDITVSELNRELKSIGMPVLSKMLTTARVPRASAIFGPKLGAFFANLSGADGYLTMDLWWTRTINRYRGDVLPKVSGLKNAVDSKGKPIGLHRFKWLVGKPDLTDKQALRMTVEHAQRYADRGYKDGDEAERAANTLYKAAFVKLQEQPLSAKERAFMIDVASAARNEVYNRTGTRYSVADIQALIWYYEKRLMAEMGAKESGDISYEEAAKRAVTGSGADVFAQGANNVGADRDDQPTPGGRGPGADPQRLPDLERASPGPVAGVRGLASAYMRRVGLPVRHQNSYVKVDKTRAEAIAQAYEDMPDSPDDPEVQRAYQALAQETVAQYDALVELGFKFEWITGDDPYATPAEAIKDMQDNGHLWVFPTDSGFGTLNEASAKNPLLAMSGRVVDGREARVNDLFRIVYDVFGHGSEGASFGARGEENAWQAHVRMFSPLAARAMTTETRGQNSWVNFGPYGEKNRANPKETVFADQKVGLLPGWVSEIGQAEDAALPEGTFFQSAGGIAAVVQTTDLPAEELVAAVAKAEELMSQEPISPLSAYKNKGLAGKVTAKTRQPVMLPIEVLQGLPGTADEARAPGDPKFDNLNALVGTYGFTQVRDGDEIEVRVNHIGQAFIYEGNTRVAVAAARGVKEVRTKIKWMNGAERVAGPMSPDTLFEPTALYQGAPGVRTAEIATASDFDGELSLDMFRKRGWFIVSATQSHFGAWDSAENVAEAERMRSWLQSAGLAHREVRSRYAGTDDGPSFLVFGDETTYGETARSMFRQESVLTRRGFVYSPYEERKPVPLVGLRMGDALNPDEDYQTTLPDGRTFTLDLDWPAPKSDDPRDDLVLREDGKVEMTHWSPRERTTIDPAKAGKGPLDGPEHHRSGPNKAFYGLNVGKRNTAYKRESPSLGGLKHTAAVDPKRLYPWDSDPDGLRAKVNGKLPQVQQIGAYEQAIKKAGYAGYFVIDGPLGDVATVFEALPVEKVEIDMALYQSTVDAEAATAASEGEEAYRTARARASAENPAFRAWFGESKVVDASGSPLVVYHGTRAKFTEFDPTLAQDGAHWFTVSKTHASVFTDGAEPGSFYLRLVNPKVIVQEDLEDAVDDDSDEPPRGYVAQFVEQAKAEGHDGLEIRNFSDAGEDNDVYLVFEAPAVKSVFNRGTFDPNEADILLQGRPDGARGQIILPPKGSDAAPEITLFDRADLSTVIHEGGHWMLWMLQTGAATGDVFSTESMEAVKAWLVSQAEDIAKEVDLIAPQVLEYLANGTTGAADVDAALHRGIHERFARGFEAYMREGKAPSVVLRGTFHRFAAWLMEVYKSATKLRVQLSDEVRQVFDKMIATDAQIAQARQLSVSAEQIAATAKAMGLDQISYEELVRLQDEERAEAFGLALRETLAPIMVQRTKEMRSIRTGLQKKISDEVNDQRHNRAFEWLANGRWAGVAEVPDDLPADLRMDPGQLAEDYGIEILDKLPRGRRPMTRPGGLSADETAGWFGYVSGAEMLNDLTTKPRARDEIKQRVQAEMAEMVAARDPREEAEQAAAIVDALHGEKHGQVLAAELRAINRISNRKRTTTSRQQAAMMARDIIARMPVRDAIRSDLYDRQARAHGEQASRLLIAGDTEAAFEAKRKQLIQHSLFVESRKAADLVARTERKATQLKRAGTRKNLAGEYLEAIDDLLYTYDFRKLSAAAEQRRGGLVRYIEMMVKAGRENELAIPDHLVTNASRVPYKTLSVQRLQGVLDALSNIEHTARLKKKLLDRQRERDMDAVVEDIEKAFENNVRGKDLNRVPTGAERVRDSVREYVNYASNADTLLRRVDGWETGEVYRHLKAGIDRASTEEVTMRLRASEQLDRLFNSYGRGERRQMSIRQVWKGYDQSLSKWDLISIALNSGNKDNWERLTSRDNPRAIPASVAQALLENLDERDWKFVQSVWDHLDAEYWPQIAAREKRTTGVVPKKVEAQLMATVKGMPAGISGGYYPIVYDRRFSAKVAEEKHQEIQTAMQAGRFGKAQTKNGHTKERAAGSGGRTIELGMHVLFGHVNQVIHDIALSEEVANAWKILQQPRVRGLFERAGLLTDLASLEVWLQDVASGQIVAGGVLGRLARHAKSGFTVSKLAFNMSTVLIQPTGLVQTAAFLGKRSLATGYSSYVAQGIFPAAARVKARSAFMAERERTFQRDMFDLIGEVNSTPLAGALGDARALLMNAGFWAMQKMQFYVVDMPTWIAGYEHGRKRGMSDDEAVEHADRVVARAQASGVYADRTAIERGTLGRDTRQNEFLRLFTALGSYMFAKFNIAQEIAGRTSRDVRDPDKSTIAAVLNGTIDMALIFTVEAVLYHLIKGTLPGDEEEDERSWLQFLATQTALSAMGTLPFIRDMGSALQGFDGGGAYGGVLETLAKPLVEIGQGEMDKGLIRSINDLVGIAAPGYPSTAIWRLADAEMARQDDKEVSPLHYIMGLPR